MSDLLQLELRSQLSKYERVMIIDSIVHNKEIDRSQGALAFYEYWFDHQGKGFERDESKSNSRWSKFQRRELPNLADFALGYLKMYCNKNDIEFDSMVFNEADYSIQMGNENIDLLKDNARRTIQYDKTLLEFYLNQSEEKDQLKFNRTLNGYEYLKGLGLSLNKLERKQLNTIKHQTAIVLDKMRQLNATGFDMEDVIQELDSVLGTTPKVKDVGNIISYEREKSINNTTHFNKLFNYINNKERCLMSWENNLGEKNTNIPITPLFLRQHNNRWYVLYIREEYLSIVETFRALDHFEELCLDHFDITPLDQIKKLDSHPDKLKQPKYLQGMGKKYFSHVFGTGRPRTYDKDPEATRSIYPERVIFRISATDPKAKFLRFRLKPKGPSSPELEAELFPNMKINMEKSNEDFTYYDAELYVAPDAINRILSYLPLIEVIEGEQTKNAIRERVSQYNVRRINQQRQEKK